MAVLWGLASAGLEHYLDLMAARQRVTASNIANADTPGYRARELDFRAEMQTFLQQGQHGNGSYPAVLVSERRGQGARNDGNNVNLDREMKSLAENVLRFTVASSLLQKQIQGLRSAITEGKGS
jgi:flagellar basal-body rod protein FlgB